MSFVIAVTNLKGGVGKTTIATNLAVAFMHKNYSVCLLDTDEKQHSALEWASVRGENLPHISVYGVKKGQITKEANHLRKSYDIIIIDGTPQLSEVADRTMLASDVLIIPLLPSIYDYRGFEVFLEQFEKVRQLKQMGGYSLQAYVVLNRVVQHSKLSQEITEAIAEYDEVRVLATKLVNRIPYADTAQDGMGVVESTHRKDKKAKAEFWALTAEIENLLQESS